MAAWDASLGRGGKAASDISTQQTCSTYTDNEAVEVVVVVGISFAMWKPKEKEGWNCAKKLSSSTKFVCYIDGLMQLYITPHVTDKHKERNEQTNRWRRKKSQKSQGWRWTDTYRRKRRIKCPSVYSCTPGGSYPTLNRRRTNVSRKKYTRMRRIREREKKRPVKSCQELSKNVVYRLHLITEECHTQQPKRFYLSL